MVCNNGINVTFFFIRTVQDYGYILQKQCSIGLSLGLLPSISSPCSANEIVHKFTVIINQAILMCHLDTGTAYLLM